MSLKCMSSIKYTELKDLIYKLDGGVCHICKHKVKYEETTLDHIVPTAISGNRGLLSTDDYWNIRLAHKSCNARRSNAKIGGQIRLPLPLS